MRFQRFGAFSLNGRPGIAFSRFFIFCTFVPDQRPPPPPPAPHGRFVEGGLAGAGPVQKCKKRKIWKTRFRPAHSGKTPQNVESAHGTVQKTHLAPNGRWLDRLFRFFLVWAGNKSHWPGTFFLKKIKNSGFFGKMCQVSGKHTFGPRQKKSE